MDRCRHILFLTGTRADFGKLKPLISACKAEGYETRIFATGMHMQAVYGLTHFEIQKAGFEYFPYYNYAAGMDGTLASTITGLSNYVRENRPDLIVIHGDRVEALAGACVGALNNILTAHIEGGELSGTVDELIRHAVSKLSHIHFVSNDEAAARLRQMGEGNIFVIGSPDIDIMLSDTLPSLGEVRRKYDIPANYAVFCYHPVTTELDRLETNIREICAALLATKLQYVVIYPNNDAGAEVIVRELDKLPYKKLPSMRFEYFLTMLKNALCIVGNSSAGIKEAPVYGVPTVNIGTRQNGRACLPSIVNVAEDRNAIYYALKHLPIAEPCLHFGAGNSAVLFMEQLDRAEFWDTPKQKVFRDII
jgi:UDP-N-acetylglucosamine 2-epimerase (hydrolysing)